jgi:hypothetical protein
MSESPASTDLFARGHTARRAAAQRFDHDAPLDAAVHDAARYSGPRALTVECAGIGGALGGTVGVVVAALLSMASVSLPAIGLVIAGPLAAALMGAGCGATAGAVLGAWLDARAAHQHAPGVELAGSADGTESADALWPAGASDRIDTATR